MKQIIKILSLLSAIIVVSQISFLEVGLGNIYYLILLVVFIVLLFLGKGLKIGYLMITFLFAGIISILLNDIPSFFQPSQRFLIFVIVVGLIGPLVSNTALQTFRLKISNQLNNIILLTVTLSFIGIAIGLPAMIGRGGFVGLFNHSMTLGPISAISMLVAMQKSNIAKSRIKYLFFASLAAISFITCVASGSRVALFAGIAGGIFFYFKVNQGRTTRFVRAILITVFIGVFSFPIWEVYTERIIGKIEESENQGDAFITRAWLWDMRIKEFNSSPIYGVGFAAVDTNISEKFNKDDGRVEPGSSWLAILSMTGLLGFIPLFLLIGKSLLFIIKDKQQPVLTAFLGGILIFFIIHMLAEGYVLSAGSGLFFYFWLSLGIIKSYQGKKY